MTNAGLLDLLREARENLASMGMRRGGPSSFDRQQADRGVADLHARIDAALAEGCPDCGHRYGQQEYCQGDGHAEYADSATQVVEWKTEMGLHATTVNGVNIAVFPMTEDGKWTAALHVAEPFNTLDEAKAAAIAAARGMR